MACASSATRTWSASRSASENTATARMPSSRSVAVIRHAISPRLAIRTFLNMNGAGLALPLRLALLEERGEAVLRLDAGAHLGERARQSGAVFLPCRVAPQLEQGLHTPLRCGRAAQQLVDALLHSGIQIPE